MAQIVTVVLETLVVLVAQVVLGILDQIVPVDLAVHNLGRIVQAVPVVFLMKIMMVIRIQGGDSFEAIEGMF